MTDVRAVVRDLALFLLFAIASVAVAWAGDVCSSPCGDKKFCLDGRCSRVVSGDSRLDAALVEKGSAVAREFIVSEQTDGKLKPSELYKWPDLLRALHKMHSRGAGPYRFYMGDASDRANVRWKYGLVNVLAFLAQAMEESIHYDVCDENNWDEPNGYKISSACGQLGQTYADFDCDLACPRDPNLEVTAVTHARWWGAPGPLFCASDRALAAAGLGKDGKTGHWDTKTDCHPYPAAAADFKLGTEPAYLRPECTVYAGQKGGKWVWDGSGDSVEGCCWWGRGAIQTSGRCNIGTLNHFLGHGHLDSSQHPRSWKLLYRDVDFCKNPEAICSSAKYPELKWIAGLFYWTNSIQTYDKGGWKYRDRLKAFVDSGLKDPSFIDGVSGIVNRGCPNPPCNGGEPVHRPEVRRAHFEAALKAFGLTGAR